MEYKEVVQAIEGKRRFGHETGVEVSSKMLQVFHHPLADMPWIHIAGTNGKGSVSAFLCRILQEAGLRVGMFTSPHLVDFRERIRVNGAYITKEAAARIGGELLRRDYAVNPTMFDYCMMMAVLYFREQKCDVAVMETGLGGRLDSTNALGVPDVTVITRIGYDHMEILGDSLELIAAEKAAVIKPGTTVVLAPQQPEAARVCEEAAGRAAAAVRRVEEREIVEEGFDGERQYFSYRNYRHLSMGLLGAYQFENAAAAVAAAEAFCAKRGRPLGSGIVEKGIAKAVWPGRMQVLRRAPFFMVDGAHNADGAKALKQGLIYLFPGEKFHFLMGVMADKEYVEMVDTLAPLALDFGTVTVDSERALQAKQLAACISARGIGAVCHDTVEAALDWVSGAGADKSIAFGSLYFIGAIEALFGSNYVD